MVTAPVRTAASFLLLHDYPSPEIKSLWDGFLARIDSPAHYDSPDYFLEPHWAGKAPFAVLALDGDCVIGVVTDLHLAHEVICGLPTRPQSRIDDAEPFLASELLAQGLLAEAGEATLITVFVWSWVPLPGFEERNFRRRELEGDVVLDLELGTERLLKESHNNRKRNIRIALKNGIEVSEASTSQDLADYWSVYSAWRKTERKEIVHNLSYATIEQVHHLRENHRRFLARYKGKLIAATGLRFRRRGLVEYTNNCSLDEFMYLRPNDLLIWKTIEWACAQGFRKYSLGAAHPFLRKSGGEVIPIWRYRLDRSFLRRHDLKEMAVMRARSWLRAAPPGLTQFLRKLRKKASRSKRAVPGAKSG